MFNFKYNVLEHDRLRNAVWNIGVKLKRNFSKIQLTHKNRQLTAKASHLIARIDILKREANLNRECLLYDITADIIAITKKGVIA